MRITQVSEGPLEPMGVLEPLRWIAGFLFWLLPFRPESYPFEDRRYCGHRSRLAGTFARLLPSLHRDAAGHRAILPLLIAVAWL